MTYLIKKLFTLILVPLFIACTPAKAAWPNWRDYFPSSLSVKRDNLKEWTIPVLGATALVTAGYFGYKYMAGRKKDSKAAAPTPQITPDSTPEVVQKTEAPFVAPEPKEQSFTPDMGPIVQEIIENACTQAARVEQARAAVEVQAAPVIADAYEVKEKEEQSVQATVKQLNVLTQTDNASCGLHALKNAVMMLDNDHDFHNNQQFQEKATLYKQLVIKKRVKEALKNALQEYLLNTITYKDISLKQYISPDYKKEFTARNDLYEFNGSVRGIVSAVVDGPGMDISGITDINARSPKPCTVHSTTLTSSLGIALEKHKETTVAAIRDVIDPDETIRANLQQFDLLDVEQLNILSDLTITHEMATAAFFAKYLSKTAQKSNLSQQEVEQLQAAVTAPAYESFLLELMQQKPEIEQQAREQLWNVQHDLSLRHDDNLYVQALSDSVAKNNLRQQQFILQLSEKYNISLPNNNSLLNNLFGTPSLFADAQGLWLTGGEVAHIVTTVHEPLKHNIAIIDNTDSIYQEWFELPEAEAIKKLLQRNQNFSYAFIINNTRSKISARGHWFTVVLQKTGNTLEFVILDSTQVKEKAMNDYLKIIQSLAGKIGITVS